jgi:hypothetical protein
MGVITLTTIQITQLISTIVSDAASYVTGTAINVDGDRSPVV